MSLETDAETFRSENEARWPNRQYCLAAFASFCFVAYKFVTA